MSGWGRRCFRATPYHRLSYHAVNEQRVIAVRTICGTELTAMQLKGE